MYLIVKIQFKTRLQILTSPYVNLYMSLNYAKNGITSGFALKMLEEAQVPKLEVFRVQESVLTPPPQLLQKNTALQCPMGRMQVQLKLLNVSHKMDRNDTDSGKSRRKRKHDEIAKENDDEE